MDPVSTLVMEQGDRIHNEHIHLARLIALALTQPLEPSDSTQRQAILHAESASALVDILRGQYQPPNSSAELAQLRVDLHSAEASNASLQKRLGSSLDQVAQLKLQLETSERECHLWKREVDKSVGLITSLRKALTASGAELKAAQTAEITATQSALHAAELMIKSRDEDITALSWSIVERDEAYASASDSAAVPTPGPGSAAALPPSSSSASTQVPLRHRPSRSIEALRRVRKDKLTPSQRLRVLANPESATAAGPRKRKVVLPPLQPYGQPLPGEEGYEEAAALIGPPDDRLLAASDSELTVPPARPLPRQRKTAKTAPPQCSGSSSAESSGRAIQDANVDCVSGGASGGVASHSAAPTSVGQPAGLAASSTQPVAPLASSLSMSTPLAMTVPSSSSVVVSVIPLFIRPLRRVQWLHLGFLHYCQLNLARLGATVELGCSSLGLKKSFCAVISGCSHFRRVDVSVRLQLLPARLTPSCWRTSGLQTLWLLVSEVDRPGLWELSQIHLDQFRTRLSYLATRRMMISPPPASASAGLPSSSYPTKKHRKGKKKHKHKHKHKTKHKGQHKSKRKDRHKDQHKETKSQAKRPRSPSPGELSASDSGAPLKRHKVSARSPAAANSAPGPEPSPNSAGGSRASPNSAGMALPSQLSVSIAVLRTRAMLSASRDSRITPQLARLRDLPFFHAGSRRCWLKILSHQAGRVPMEPHGARSRVRVTLSTLAGIRAFVDVFNPQHPFQQLRRMLPDTPSFFSPGPTTSLFGPDSPVSSAGLLLPAVTDSAIGNTVPPTGLAIELLASAAQTVAAQPPSSHLPDDSSSPDPSRLQEIYFRLRLHISSIS
ncbi:Hypothetical protein PHPALM_20962 [Phytophthora palmivora]|uniref:Uncharacterized protein n=1 Tax=Phytophthora palmivora TaxID=4796 RepID=A0A2P4XDI4_9STRA|nr:Hypothetical protein PHPALM_20962 [Phytophthora palmivora]